MDILDINPEGLGREGLPYDSNTCPVSDAINIISSVDTTYEQFFEDYLLSNRPCVIRNVSLDWISQHSWIKDGKPDFEFLKRKYGNSLVHVANCKERFFNSQSKCSMTLAEFLTYWENHIENAYDEEADCLYMKDWHFANEYPEEVAYTVPKFFASDWINEYLVKDERMDDDYRFVYMGPKGSWTPLHVDVFNSFSWSVNICGEKKWIFLPPGEEEKLKDRFGNLAFDIKSTDLSDSAIYPNYSSDLNKIVLIQGTGDAIFVPSGWHHQVWNSDDTVSFNHNWVNGCNIMRMWESMNLCFESVCREISDCRDMEGWDDQCQLVLKSCFGMDFKDFIRFIAYIALTRKNHIRNKSVLRVSGGWGMGHNHIMFDLSKVNELLVKMAGSSLISLKHVDVDIESLFNEIQSLFPCSYPLV